MNIKSKNFNEYWIEYDKDESHYQDENQAASDAWTACKKEILKIIDKHSGTDIDGCGYINNSAIKEIEEL